MRIRSIKPEFWRSRDISSLDWETRLVFVGMLSYCDDNGVGRDDVLAIVGDLFALEEDPVETRKKVGRSLEVLEAHKLILRYVDGAGRPLLFVTGWDHHQRVSNPNKPRYRRPESAAGGDAVLLFYDDLRSINGDPNEVLRLSPTAERRALESTADRELSSVSLEPNEVLVTGAGEQGNRGTGEQRNRGGGESRSRGSRLPSDWVPSEALLTYAEEHAPSVRPLDEAERFRDYWLASNRANAVKRDWSAAFRTWLRKQHEWNITEHGWTEPGKEWMHQ